MNSQTEQQTTLRDLIFILFKHKIIIAACLFSVTTTVYLIVSQKVPKYKATTTLLLKFGRENAFRFSTPDGTSTIWDKDKKDSMNSEMAILQGRDLAKATLIDVGLENIYPFLAYEKTPTDNSTDFSYPLEQAINIFLKSFNMKTIEKSTIFKIDFFHTNPNVAALTLNKFVDNYLVHHLKIYQEPEQFIFFTTQVSKYKKFLITQKLLCSIISKIMIFYIFNNNKLSC